MTSDAAIREHVARLLSWDDAHVAFDAAIAGVPRDVRGRQPSGLHSPWQLLEHLRIAQHDILDFCRNPRYEEKTWPDDYWPKTPGPKSAAAWSQSLAGYRRDRKAMQRLAADRRIDLFAGIPHGSGQTYLREILLVADHAAYHIAQIVDIRRAMGIWRV